jgi:hypothetical protein
MTRQLSTAWTNWMPQPPLADPQDSPPRFGSVTLNRDTTRDAQEFYYSYLRSLTGVQRAEMAAEMTHDARQLCRDGIAYRHPEYSSSQIHLAFVRLLLGDDLFQASHPGVTLLAP